MLWPHGDFCKDKILGYIMSPADIFHNEFGVMNLGSNPPRREILNY